MRGLVVLLLFLLSSCGGAINPTLTVSCNGCDKDALNLAIKNWNDSQGYEVFAFIDSDADIDIEPVQFFPQGFDAYSFPDSPIIQIQTNFQSWQLIAHELGHKLGLNDSVDHTSLMFHDNVPDAPVFPLL